MPVMSYLIYPAVNKKDSIIKSLNDLKGCKAVPADNEDLIVLVTETESDQQEKDLKHHIESIKSIQCMAMVYGHADEAGGVQQ